MSYLSFLCGNARSGKSYYAKRWEESYDDADKIVISGDDIRTAFHGKRYVYKLEPMIAAIVPIVIKTSLLHGYYVLFDDTNTSLYSLKMLFRIDPQAIPVIVNTPKDVCLTRAANSNQLDLCPAIHRMHNNLVQLAAYGLGEPYYADNKVLTEDIERGIEKIREQTMQDLSLFDREV